MLAYNNFSYIYIYIGQPLHNQTQLGSTTKPLTLHTELTRKKKELHNCLNSLNLSSNHLHLQLLTFNIAECNVQVPHCPRWWWWAYSCPIKLLLEQVEEGDENC